MSNSPDKVTLYFREGTSDKVYQVKIVPEGDGFVVNFAYGRRGAKLTTGTKTPKPVARDQAEQIYKKLVDEKTAKGYSTADPAGDEGNASGAKVFEHPDWGKFKYDGVAWVKSIEMPAFKAFKHGSRPKGKFDLWFLADDENDLPNADAVAVAERALANQKALAEKTVTALWDDISGVGPDSGMYWHGDVDQLVEGMEFEDDPTPPEEADDLYKLMRFTTLVVHKDVNGYAKPVVELSFAAAFEEEHGVGVLTDGEKILGLGYSNDVTPLKT